MMHANDEDSWWCWWCLSWQRCHDVDVDEVDDDDDDPDDDVVMRRIRDVDVD